MMMCRPLFRTLSAQKGVQKRFRALVPFPSRTLGDLFEVVGTQGHRVLTGLVVEQSLNAAPGKMITRLLTGLRLVSVLDGLRSIPRGKRENCA